MDSLPVEIIQHIFIQLDPYSIPKNRLVCAEWLTHLQDNRMWKKIYNDLFGFFENDSISYESILFYSLDSIADKSVGSKALWAVQTDSISMLKSIMMSDTKIIWEKIDPLLFEATHNNNIDMINLLLKYKNPSTEFEPSYNSLCLAAQEGFIDICKIFIDNGFDPDTIDCDLFTPLLSAVCNGHFHLVEYLCNIGVDFEKSSNDITPVYMAAVCGHGKILKFLISKGTNPNLDFVSMLHGACWNGRLETMRILIELGADIHSKSDGNVTILHIASRRGYFNIVTWVLDNYAFNLEIKDIENYNALHYASRGAHDKIVGLLLDRGANVNALGKRDLSSLYIACTKGFGNIIRILLAAGADPNLMGLNGRTALHMVIGKNLSDMVDLLCAHGADPNKRGSRYYTPLGTACHFGYIECVRILLKYEADPYITFNNRSCFDIAINNAEITELLFESTKKLNV